MSELKFHTGLWYGKMRAVSRGWMGRNRGGYAIFWAALPFLCSMPYAANRVSPEKCSILSIVRPFPKGAFLNYVIDQVAAGARHAGSKARDDVNSILQSKGFSKELIECSYDPGIGSILKDTFYVPHQIKRIIKSFDNGSFFVVQFPFRCFSARLGKQICRIAHRKNCFAVALIHDLSALRSTESQPNLIESTIRNEIVFLSQFDCIIAHNSKMKQYLVDRGIEERRIIDLKLFDYLLPGPSPKSPIFAKKISVAGNLASQKTRYLRLLQNIPNKIYDVDLYGTNWDEDTDLNRVRYRGAFQPEEISGLITEGFGLVWDGDSLDGCSGDYGSYLRFNNPHKLSSYIACGVPIITWNHAAIAPLIEKAGIGATVSSLNELDGFFSSLTETDYYGMADNVSHIKAKVISGHYLSDAIDKALNLKEIQARSSAAVI